jgi:Uma2 family endonuclease
MHRTAKSKRRLRQIESGECLKRPLVTGALNAPLVLFRMDSDSFCNIPISETVKLELLDGEVVALPWPTRDQLYCGSQLGFAITQHAKARSLGRVLPDILMMLDDGWTPAPDLVYVGRQHLRRVKEKRIEGPVVLAIEILGASHPEIDRTTKFRAYGRLGI